MNCEDPLVIIAYQLAASPFSLSAGLSLRLRLKRIGSTPRQWLLHKLAVFSRLADAIVGFTGVRLAKSQSGDRLVLPLGKHDFNQRPPQCLDWTIASGY